LFRQHDVAPRHARLDPTSQPFETGGVLGPRSRLQIGHLESAVEGNRPAPAGQRGPKDLLGRQAKLRSDRRWVQARRSVTIQGLTPDRVSLSLGRCRRVDQQRHFPRPIGVPPSRTDEYDRASRFAEGPDGRGTSLGQEIDRSGYETTAGQTSLPYSGCRRFPRIVLRSEAKKIQNDGWKARSSHSGDRERMTCGANTFSHIEEACSISQRASKRASAISIHFHAPHQEGADRWIRSVVSKQVRRNPIRNP
jgi:hypothetical protein